MRIALVSIALVVAWQFIDARTVFSGALLQVDGRPLRWESPIWGTTTIITYAVLTDTYSVPSNKSILSPSNCAAMHAFGSIFTNSPGPVAAAAAGELREAFTNWEEVANIAFIEVGDPSIADIVVGAQDIPQGKAFTNLSYRSSRTITTVAKALGKAASDPSVSLENFMQNGTVTGIDQAYVCLNPSSRWKVGFDGKLDVYDLRYTFTHEIGHAIGLDHPDRADALMSSHYDERVQTLQPSDISAVRSLYGPSKREK